ncbi:hypothetical protein [Tateyamaria omphalii]|uniref:hypothetical protein n=1 Tax=Tateyamaria omphalii TaxID=299262 RepID=UPI0012F87624|nr:hypothetical protein [Tateyamaria omphalii]
MIQFKETTGRIIGGNLIIGASNNTAETVIVSSNQVVGADKAVTVGGGYQGIVSGVHNRSIGICALKEVGHNKSIVVGKIYELRVGKSKLTTTEDCVISLTGVHVKINGEELTDMDAARVNKTRERHDRVRQGARKSASPVPFSRYVCLPRPTHGPNGSHQRGRL